MCENAPSREEIEVLINADSPRNKLQYVLDQAIAWLSYRLVEWMVEWEKLKFPDCKKNYVELLNNFVGNGMARFKTDSERLQSRMKVICSKAKKKQHELKQRGTKKQKRGILQFLDKSFNPEK